MKSRLYTNCKGTKSVFLVDVDLEVLEGQFTTAASSHTILKIPSLIAVVVEPQLSLQFSPLPYFSEDLVLAEERTTEKDRKRIMEGKRKRVEKYLGVVSQLFLFQHAERPPRGSVASKPRRRN